MSRTDSVWTRFVHAARWMLLLLIYHGLFASVGLVLRLLRCDLLDLEIDRRRSTYWHEREGEGFDPADYERQS
jgi:hypothetical protein